VNIVPVESYNFTENETLITQIIHPEFRHNIKPRRHQVEVKCNIYQTEAEPRSDACQPTPLGTVSK